MNGPDNSPQAIQDRRDSWSIVEFMYASRPMGHVLNRDLSLEVVSKMTSFPEERVLDLWSRFRDLMVSHMKGGLVELTYDPNTKTFKMWRVKL